MLANAHAHEQELERPADSKKHALAHRNTHTHTSRMPWIWETKSFEEWRPNLICLSQCVRTIIVNVMWKCIESCRLVGFGLAPFLTCILFDSMQMGSFHTKKKDAKLRTHPLGTLHIAHWILGASGIHRIAHTFRSQTNIRNAFTMHIQCNFIDFMFELCKLHSHDVSLRLRLFPFWWNHFVFSGIDSILSFLCASFCGDVQMLHKTAWYKNPIPKPWLSIKKLFSFTAYCAFGLSWFCFVFI